MRFHVHAAQILAASLIHGWGLEDSTAEGSVYFLGSGEELRLEVPEEEEELEEELLRPRRLGGELACEGTQ